MLLTGVLATDHVLDNALHGSEGGQHLGDLGVQQGADHGKHLQMHSVLFPILGLPLFGRRKNYHQLPTLFWLEMIHMMGLSTVIKKKSVGKCGKACFSTFVCFPF